MKINNADSPLWNAIKRLKEATRKKAPAQMIERLEARVREETEKVAVNLGPDWKERIKEPDPAP